MTTVSEERRRRAALAARKRAALKEFAAIAVDVARLPGTRTVAWWIGVKQAVCEAYNVPDLMVPPAKYRRRER